MILILATIVALLLHLLLGWQFSLAGGLVAGIAARRLGWIQGLVAVATSWLILVVYNFATAPDEMARFVKITSDLFGNMPGWLLVGTTIGLGGLLGLLGGLIGTQLRTLFLLFRGNGLSDDRTETPPGNTNPQEVI